MKSFYDFYNKLQKINEENEIMNPKVADMGASLNAGSDTSMDMQPNMSPDMSSDMSKGEVPLLSDKSKSSGEEDESNLSPPEGKINYKFINKNLKHISKYISKFKNLDEEKGQQLEQLISQVTNLVNSFEEPSSEEEDTGSEDETTSGEEPSADMSQDLGKMVGDQPEVSPMPNSLSGDNMPQQPSMNAGQPSIV